MAGYAAARRDPVVINGIAGPALAAQSIQWISAVVAIARPGETSKVTVDPTNDLGVRRFIAEMFRLPIPNE